MDDATVPLGFGLGTRSALSRLRSSPCSQGELSAARSFTEEAVSSAGPLHWYPVTLQTVAVSSARPLQDPNPSNDVCNTKDI